MPPRRAISPLIYELIIVTVAIVLTSLVFGVLRSSSDVLPQGPMITISGTAEHIPYTTENAYMVHLAITCNGPQCSEYWVTDITLTGYNESNVAVYFSPANTGWIQLHEGTTVIDIPIATTPDTTLRYINVDVETLGPNDRRSLYKYTISVG